MTKRSLVETCRKLLYSATLNEPIEDPTAVEFLRELIQRHPESAQKIGAGVDYFTVALNDWRKRCFWLRRVDGSVTDFSFLACISPPTTECQALAAFRHAIRDQITNFKTSWFQSRSEHFCEVTKSHLTMSSAHVDHHPTAFRDLVDTFLASEGIELSGVAIVPTTDASIITALADAGLEARWSKFHAHCAGLRVISASANLRKKRNRRTADGFR